MSLRIFLSSFGLLIVSACGKFPSQQDPPKASSALMAACYPIKDASECSATGCTWSQEGCGTEPGDRFNLCLGSDVKKCDPASPSCETGTTCQPVSEVACGGSGGVTCQACGTTRYLCLPPP
jgi:hypothetical protein